MKKEIKILFVLTIMTLIMAFLVGSWKFLNGILIMLILFCSAAIASWLINEKKREGIIFTK